MKAGPGRPATPDMRADQFIQRCGACGSWRDTRRGCSTCKAYSRAVERAAVTAR